jgi:hypothetical protein
LRTGPARRATARIRGRINNRFDPAVDTDGVDHRLPKNLIAAGPRKALSRTGVHQTERQRLIVDRNHLSVLAQHDPREPTLRLHGIQHLRPQPPNIHQPNSPTLHRLPTHRGLGRYGLRSRRGLRDRSSRHRRLVAPSPRTRSTTSRNTRGSSTTRRGATGPGAT